MVSRRYKVRYSRDGPFFLPDPKLSVKPFFIPKMMILNDQVGNKVFSPCVKISRFFYYQCPSVGTWLLVPSLGTILKRGVV